MAEGGIEDLYAVQDDDYLTRPSFDAAIVANPGRALNYIYNLQVIRTLDTDPPENFIQLLHYARCDTCDSRFPVVEMNWVVLCATCRSLVTTQVGVHVSRIRHLEAARIEYDELLDEMPGLPQQALEIARAHYNAIITDVIELE